ncbi:hypothetical protein CesoFtcFv8_008021 [Champsocephalus esox]|uniref:LIM zinc-binding domain-containing protein n=1 Tax=Champsocephalus esox TaxID=159716 RepID=A0AAN8CFD2_9TELE|nr:hypothetical protein CesoFtcFv8_008021 [Champsocephalus esox]
MLPVQRTAQGLPARERRLGRSRKERADLLASMCPGSNKPPPPPPPPPLPPISKSQVELPTSSCPSLSPSPPPSSSVSQSPSVYPVVHPVPEPTAQTGFSSSHTDSEQISSPVVDSSSCHNNTSEALSSSCSETGCEHGHSRSSSRHASSPHNQNYEGKSPSSWKNLKTEQKKSCKSAQLDTNDPIKCNGSNTMETPNTIKKSIVRSESCPTGAPRYMKERTVGKVSSIIDAKAQKLAVLYETDHRPNAAPCVLYKDFAPGLGGSDVCHFCTKRVYVMERLSAEGYFFHRECFRCDICNSTLRLGGYIYDSEDGKFYCKMHYAQRQSSDHMRRFRRRIEDQSHVPPPRRWAAGATRRQTACRCTPQVGR